MGEKKSRGGLLGSGMMFAHDFAFMINLIS